MEKKKAKGEKNPRDGAARKGANGAATHEAEATAGPAFFDPEVIAKEMGLYWQSGKGEQFLRRMPDGRWAVWAGQAIVDGLRKFAQRDMGRLLTIKAREGEILSEVKEILNHVRENRWVDEVFTALPGYRDGIYDLDTGEKVLVKTSPPKMVEPVAGEWPTIRGLINGRLDLTRGGAQAADEARGVIDQTPWFHAWCKVAFESLRNGRPGQWRSGHCMILTGPAGCGKNRLQENLITPLLAGRQADPTKFLFDGDEFNADVFKAEHLMMGEIPNPSQRTVDRNTLAERIKQVVANAAQRMRLMRTEPWTVYPFWRLSISVNDHPDKLNQLPLITGDFGDKVLLFHCAQEPLPMPADTDAEREAFRDALTRELPAYAHWLVHEFEIPAELLTYPTGRSATRFGFREFHHPVIKEGLFEDTTAAQMMGLIDLAEFESGQFDGRKLKLWEMESWSEKEGMWWERADVLQQLLTGEVSGVSSSVSQLAKRLFGHVKCSTLLSRLAADEMHGSRIEGGESARLHRHRIGVPRGARGWKIARPPMTGA